TLSLHDTLPISIAFSGTAPASSALAQEATSSSANSRGTISSAAQKGFYARQSASPRGPSPRFFFPFGVLGPYPRAATHPSIRSAQVSPHACSSKVFLRLRRRLYRQRRPS